MSIPVWAYCQIRKIAFPAFLVHAQPAILRGFFFRKRPMMVNYTKTCHSRCDEPHFNEGTFLFHLAYWEESIILIAKMDLRKWTTFCRSYVFQVCFRERKLLYFVSNLTEVSSYGPNWQAVTIDSGDGLMPIIQQVVSYTNGGLINWRIYVAKSQLMEWVDNQKLFWIFYRLTWISI